MKTKQRICFYVAAILALCFVHSDAVKGQPPNPHTLVFRVNLPELAGYPESVQDVEWFLKDASDNFKTEGCKLSSYFYNAKAGLFVVNLTDAWAHCATRFKYDQGDSIQVRFTTVKTGKSPRVVTLAVQVDDRSTQWLGEVSGLMLKKAGAEEISQIPVKFALYQNHPNPFNPETTIRYDLPEVSFVTLEIYNLLGQKIKTLVNREQVAKTYSVSWNGLDDAGRQVASGIYIYTVKAGSFTATKKMLYMR